MKFIDIPLEKLVQTRQDISEKTVLQKINLISSAGYEKINPLRCTKTKNGYEIFDGNHTYEALRRLNFKTAPVFLN